MPCWWSSPISVSPRQYEQTADIERTRGVVEGMGFGEVQVQKFGTSRDVLIRLPVRPDVQQTEVAGRVFAELCKAETGVLATKQYTTPQGEQVSRPGFRGDLHNRFHAGNRTNTLCDDFRGCCRVAAH